MSSQKDTLIPADTTEQSADEMFDPINNVVNTTSSRRWLAAESFAVAESSEEQKVIIATRQAMKKASLFQLIMKLTFSNFGLMLIVCLYACLGALMFRLLEQHEELRLCEEGKGKLMREIHDLKDGLFRYILYNVTSVEINSNWNEDDGNLAKMSNLTTSNRNFTFESNSDLTSAEEVIDEMLREFRDVILEIDEKYKYYGQNCVENSKWKFFSALLFSVTVITTIGYGHVTPVTWEGQLVCICYATIGIPIFLMCLANLSSAFGEMFKFVYTGIDRINPLKRLRSNDSIEATNARKARFMNLEALLNDSAQLATLTNEQILREIGILYDPNFDDMDDDDDVDDDDDEDEDEDYASINQVQIPFVLILFIIILYIMLGAYLFQYFENWKLSESVYFIYASLSTMGFGDFIPGQRANDPRSNIKLIAIAFYSLFGIVIAGMCFSLMQGAAKRTFRKATSKLKRLFSAKKKIQETFISEADKEREKQELLSRIKLLQSFEAETTVVRKRKPDL